MRRCLSRSKAIAPLLALLMCGPLGLSTVACSAESGVREFSSYSEYTILPADKKDTKDVKWADYLKNHWQRRSLDKDCVFIGRASDESQLQVLVSFDPTLDEDYTVKTRKDEVVLTARSAESMLYVLYQFMSAAAAEDARFADDDLPPASFSCKRDTAGTFAFEYRGIYSPSNADADLMPILGTHNVDFDWGLWGHNLRKIFADGVPDTAKALVGGKRSDEQFCFSSDALFRAYASFVIDSYGEGNAEETVRFAVMPNDNDIVCQCAACRAAGNTATSATPAVSKLVERLAKRFPRHQFFTSSYSTTAQPPSRPFPDNVGVLVSAMSLPLSAKARDGKEGKALESTIKAWEKVAKQVYVWDYMRNFDDYLTPYPCLHHLQERLRFFRDLGVSGIFYNGSGYDYSTFDDMQTYVLSRLLISPDADVDACAAQYFNKYYPVTADILIPYYKEAEQRAAAKTLPTYAGIGGMVAAGLDADAFEIFWKKLDTASKRAETAERTRLNKLLTALNFPRLELLRLKPAAPGLANVQQRLRLLSGRKAFKNLTDYREANGDLDEYALQWETSFPWKSSEANLLKGKKLTLLSSVGEDTNPVSALTDGMQGFTTDYHTQWVVTPSALRLQMAASDVTSAAMRFHLSFLVAPVWHIFAPSAVEVWQEGKCVGRTALDGKEGSPMTRVETSVSVSGLSAGAQLEIRAIPAVREGRVTLACDEIEAFVQ